MRLTSHIGLIVLWVLVGLSLTANIVLAVVVILNADRANERQIQHEAEVRDSLGVAVAQFRAETEAWLDAWETNIEALLAAWEVDIKDTIDTREAAASDSQGLPSEVSQGEASGSLNILDIPPPPSPWGWGLWLLRLLGKVL
ncbi:MAG: hypothetical protein OXI96_08345 [Acidimicrobiaceae bacterium]|nr:hypothetical protein [Acidimicrobiaceae bacterium]